LQQTPDAAADGCALDLRVGETRHLIGETWYDTELSTTNRGNASATVTSIELLTEAGRYEEADATKLENAIPVNATKKFSVLFELGRR
jgi:hypothetical protein